VGVVITKDATEETAVVLNDGVGQPRKMVGIHPVTVGFVVLFVPWIVDQDRIGSWQATDNNPINCTGLVLGALEVAILLVVEITQREKGNQSALIVADAMNKKKVLGIVAGITKLREQVGEKVAKNTKLK
jgi:hypothetical protein